MILSKALTWEEIADEYKDAYGGRPMILDLDIVYDRVEELDHIHFDEEEGTLHKILEE